MEVKLDVTELAKELEEHKAKIEKIRYAKDKYLQLIRDKKPIAIDQLVSGITLEPLSF